MALNGFTSLKLRCHISFYQLGTTNQYTWGENDAATKNHQKCDAPKRDFHVTMLDPCNGPQFEKHDDQRNRRCGPKRWNQIWQSEFKATNRCHDAGCQAVLDGRPTTDSLPSSCATSVNAIEIPAPTEPRRVWRCAWDGNTKNAHPFLACHVAKGAGKIVGKFFGCRLANHASTETRLEFSHLTVREDAGTNTSD